MRRHVIRLGDPTTHGGKVVSASATRFIFGKPVARMGDKATCPIPGHGVVTIVEGDPDWTDDGKPISLEGHKCSCGCSLISTLPNVVRSPDGSGVASAGAGSAAGVAGAATTVAGVVAVGTASKPSLSGDNDQFDEQFHLVDAHDNPLPQTPYRITASNGQTWEGVADDEGLTQRIVTSDGVELSIEVFQNANKQNVIE